jgi:hypothetical protein
VPSHPNSSTSFLVVGPRISALRDVDDTAADAPLPMTTNAVTVLVVDRADRNSAVESFMVKVKGSGVEFVSTAIVLRYDGGCSEQRKLEVGRAMTLLTYEGMTRGRSKISFIFKCHVKVLMPRATSPHFLPAIIATFSSPNFLPAIFVSASSIAAGRRAAAGHHSQVGVDSSSITKPRSTITASNDQHHHSTVQASTSTSSSTMGKRAKKAPVVTKKRHTLAKRFKCPFCANGASCWC